MHTAQREIITALGTAEAIDSAREVQRRTTFLADYLRAIPGARGFVLGISGGQDSTLAGRLAQLAVEQLRAEGVAAEFVAVRLPYARQVDEADAALAVEFIAPDRAVTVNIAGATDALTLEITDASGEPVSDFNKGNIKARMRMVAQYALAGDRSLLVIGTDHAAEAVTGFFTKFGDGAADVVPLAGLTKEQGAQMLRYLGAPEQLITKIPTADLLDEAPAMSDEQSLGVSYGEIDAFLRGETVSDPAAENIVRRYRSSEHKRRMPVSPNDTWWHAAAPPPHNAAEGA